MRLTSEHTRILTLLLMILGYIGASPAYAHITPEPPLTAAEKEAIKQLDQNVLDANTAMIQGRANIKKLYAARAKSQSHDDLVEKAKARRKAMEELLTKNPKLAASRAISASMRDRMPPEVQEHIEEEVTLSGTTLLHHADDWKNNRAINKLFVRTNGGKTLEVLGLSDHEKYEVIGKNVRIKGHRFGNRLALADKNRLQKQESAPGKLAPMARAAATPSGPIVSNKVLTVVADLKDRTNECSVEQVRELVFGAGNSANKAITESANGAFTLDNWYLIPRRIKIDLAASEVGAASDIWDEQTLNWRLQGVAKDALVKSGYGNVVNDPSYGIFNLILPYDIPVVWGGRGGQITTKRGSQYVTEGITAITCELTRPQLFSHELGHAIGFHHASAIINNQEDEYGDNSDFMGGNNGNVRSNAAHRYQMGWLPSGSVIEVASSGTYSIQALGAESGTNPQVLKIAIPGSSRFYFVSLRKKMGRDAALDYNYAGKLSIHDADPGSTWNRPVLVSSLATNSQYQKAEHGIKITHLSNNTQSSSVKIEFATESCVEKTPDLVVVTMPAYVQPGMAGTISVNLKNNNSSACGSSTFALKLVAPNGWVTQSKDVVLSAQAQSTSNLSVTIPQSQATGAYAVKISAAQSARPDLLKSIEATLVVDNPDSSGPEITPTSPAANTTLEAGRSYALQASTTDASGIASVKFSFDRAGASPLSLGDGAANGSAYTFNWTVPTNFSAGAGSIRITATDTKGNVTEKIIPVSINVADTTPPSLTPTSPAADTMLQVGRSYALQAIATDASAVASVSFSVERPWKASQALGNGAPSGDNRYTLNWSVPNELAAGPATIRIIARDKAGNASEKTLPIKIGVPPALTTLQPAANAVLDAGRTYRLQALATDPSGVKSVTFAFERVGGTPLAIGNGAKLPGDIFAMDWNVPSNLVAGPGAIRVSAQDIYGNTSERMIAVSISGADTTPPSVTPLSPASNTSLEAGRSYTLQANATDASGIASVKFSFDRAGASPVVLGNGVANNSGYTLNWTVPSNFSAGPGSIRISATDTKGNVTEKTIPVSISVNDTTPPSVTPMSPAANTSLEAGRSYTLQANATDASGIASVKFSFDRAGASPVVLGDGVANDSGYTLNWTVPSSLAVGAGSIRITATDSKGNVAESTIPVNIAGTPTANVVSITNKAFSSYVVTYRADGWMYGVPWNGWDTQKWSAVQTGDSITFKSAANGLCLQSTDSIPGSKLVLSTCDGSAKQSWRMTKVTQDGTTWQMLSNAMSNLCMHPGSTGTGRLQQGSCNIYDARLIWKIDAR